MDLPLWYARLVETPTRRGPTEPESLPDLYWRPRVGRWPIDRRQKWGDRANELQDAGFGWKEAERVAFEEIMEDLKVSIR